MVTVTGNFKDLARITKGLSRLTDRASKTSLNRALGEEMLYQVRKCFETSKDPYGRAWKRLRSRSGQILRDTNRLMNSFSVRATAKGFEVGTNVKYAAIHNYGGIIRAKNAPFLVFRIGGTKGGKGPHLIRIKQVYIPKRQFIPDSDKLPRETLAALRDVTQAWMAKRFSL